MLVLGVCGRNGLLCYKLGFLRKSLLWYNIGGWSKHGGECLSMQSINIVIERRRKYNIRKIINDRKTMDQPSTIIHIPNTQSNARRIL